MAYSVEVTNAKSGKKICTLERLSPNTSILEVKGEQFDFCHILLKKFKIFRSNRFAITSMV